MSSCRGASLWKLFTTLGLIQLTKTSRIILGGNGGLVSMHSLQMLLLTHAPQRQEEKQWPCGTRTRPQLGKGNPEKHKSTLPCRDGWHSAVSAHNWPSGVMCTSIGCGKWSLGLFARGTARWERKILPTNGIWGKNFQVQQRSNIIKYVDYLQMLTFGQHGVHCERGSWMLASM